MQRIGVILRLPLCNSCEGFSELSSKIKAVMCRLWYVLLHDNRNLQSLSWLRQLGLDSLSAFTQPQPPTHQCLFSDMLQPGWWHNRNDTKRPMHSPAGVDMAAVLVISTTMWELPLLPHSQCGRPSP